MSSDFNMVINDFGKSILCGIDDIHKTIQTNIRKYPLTTLITQVVLSILVKLTASISLVMLLGMSVAFTLFNIRNIANSIKRYDLLNKNEWTATEDERQFVLGINRAQELGRGVLNTFSNLFSS